MGERREDKGNLWRVMCTYYDIRINVLQMESGPFYQFDNELQIRTILLDSVFNHSHSLYI